jgi:hypothetical protein
MCFVLWSRSQERKARTTNVYPDLEQLHQGTDFCRLHSKDKIKPVQAYPGLSLHRYRISDMGIAQC